MKTPIKSVVALFTALLAIPSHGGPVVAPSDALISIGQPENWSAVLRYQVDRREFKAADDDILIFDFNHTVAGIGYSLFPWLEVRAEAGWVKAERLGEEADGMGEWAVGAGVYPLELVLSSSPVVGKHQSLGVGVDVVYREGESNFQDEDFSWKEFKIMPMVRFTSNLEGDALRQSYEPNGISAGLGLAFSSISGDLDGEDLEENQALGLVATAHFRWESGWVTGFQGVFSGGDDRELGFSVGYNF